MKNLKLLFLLLIVLKINYLQGKDDFLIRSINAHNGAINSLTLSSDGKYFASGGTDNIVKIWDIESENCLKNIPISNNIINTIKYSPNDNFLTFGSYEYLYILNTKQTKKIKKIVAHPGWIKSICYSPDGMLIASSSTDKSIKIWDANKGCYTKSLLGHTDRVVSIDFGPTRNYLVSGSYDNTAKIWDVRTSKCIKTLKGHSDYITAAIISPFGSFVATSSADKTIKIWDFNTGKCLNVLMGHNHAITTICFKNNGNYLVSGDLSGKIKIWNIENGKCIKNINAHSKKINQIIFTKYSDNIISASSDSTIKFWNLKLFFKYDNLSTNLNNIDDYLDKKFERQISNLLLPKDEFETTLQYNTRIIKEKEKKELLLRKIEKEKQIEKIKLKQKIDRFLNHNISEKIFNTQLGIYNADGEYFTVTYNNILKKLFVPLSYAKIFKRNYYNYTIEARKQLFIDSNKELSSKIIEIYIKTDEEFFSTEQNKQLELFPELQIADVKLIDKNNDQMLENMETGLLRITIKNIGQGDATGISAHIIADENYPYLKYLNKIYISEIKSGDSKNLEFTFNTTSSTPEKICGFTVNFDELNGFYPDPIKFNLPITKNVPPDIVIECGINDINNNQKIELQEKIEVTARIFNKGGSIYNVNIAVDKGYNVFLLNDINIFNFKSIKQGEFQDVKFSFQTNKRVVKNIPISIYVESDNYRKDFPLNLTINKIEKSPQNFVFNKNTVLNNNGLTILDIDIEKNIPTYNKKNNNAVAVLIGNREYKQQDVPNVDFAERDVELMQKYLIKMMGYKPENIILIKNATQSELLSVFGSDNNYKGKLYNYVKPNQSDIFVYYSGHGAPNPESKTSYLVPVDCDPAIVSLSGYAVNTLYNNLSKIQYKSLTVVIDACFSGYSEGGAILKNVSPISLNIKNKIILKDNSVVFTSATDQQVSSWYKEKQHSLFTYFFLKGIQGSANKDRNKILTSYELRTYLNENVPYIARRVNNREQTPTIMGNKQIIVKYK